MVNKPLIRPYFLGGVALGGAARIPLKKRLGDENGTTHSFLDFGSTSPENLLRGLDVF